jgi:NADH dehydrogenase
MTDRHRVVILGAGFAGSYVARYLGKRRDRVEVTLIDPRNYMLYTPLMAEAASGTVEPRHAVVPVRVMCPHADLILGRATAVDAARRSVSVETIAGGRTEIEYDSLVVALGGISRTVSVPGLGEHAVGFKTLAEAIQLRNRVLQQLELASATTDPAARRRHLTFVFVGGGYAGVEALAELEDLVNDAASRYPNLRGVPRRWVLVEAAGRILAELPPTLARYATRQLELRGIEIRMNTTLTEVDEVGATLSTGERVPAATVVWTAGVRPNPLVAEIGVGADPTGRLEVNGHLRVRGRRDMWSLGDAAAVPNPATPGHLDPPTCQHALRQARRLAANLIASLDGEPERTYRYRMMGQVATLGQHKGVAEVLGLRLHGWPGWWVTRTYHLYQLPLPSRKLRVVSDWTVGLFFRRDVVELGSLGNETRLPPPPPPRD